MTATRDTPGVTTREASPDPTRSRGVCAGVRASNRWFGGLTGPMVWLLAFSAACVSPIGEAEHQVSVDYDGDGVSRSTDCNDLNSTVFPGAEEVCNGRDDDCDGLVDGATATDAVLWYADADGDGHGAPGSGVLACAPPGRSPLGDDCDDTNAAVRGGCE